MGSHPMSKRQGFTLVEALLALIIAAGIFVLASGTDRIILRPLRQDPVAWHQVIRVLEQPGRYRVTGIDQQQLNLVDTQHDDKPVAVWCDAKGTLRLTNQQHQGYYPLLRRVEAVQWRPTAYAGLIELRLKQERLPWQTTILNLSGTAF